LRTNHQQASVKAVLTFLLISCGIGCDEATTPESVGVKRVNAVKGNRDSLDYQKWCDQSYEGSKGPLLRLPEVESAGKSARSFTLPTDRWVWVNFWATWCKPCVREMPMLRVWQEQLVKLGQPLDLWYVSVDQDKAELERFLSEHAEIAAVNNLRVTSGDTMESWLKSYGISAMASVPIHFVAAPKGAVRCVRTGSLNDGDFSIVKNLVH